jgi:hypothetical protein
MTKANRRLLGTPPSATPEEAAAIVTAIERFMRATAPPASPAPAPPDEWRVTALLEGVSRNPEYMPTTPG